MTVLIEFKRCGFYFRNYKRREKSFNLDNTPSLEAEFLFVYILIYFGSLLKDIKNKFMGEIK